MLKIAIAAIAAIVMIHDHDDPFYDWFKAQRNNQGIICCDIADGHRTTWRSADNGVYEVPINGVWVPVPPEAVILGRSNPTGDAIVWYIIIESGPLIRCFIPGGGA